MRKTVIILGAGPAGLSIGYEMSRRGVDYLILEKGQVAGESFTHIPKDTCFGPWLNNTLPGSRVSWKWRLRLATQPAYSWYLQEYARRNQLAIQFGSVVSLVRREDKGFLVHTHDKTYHCDFVVNCTGYFSNPNKPSYPGQEESSIVALHNSEFREAADLSHKLGLEKANVLVVGAGLSSGEMLKDLHKNGDCVSLSHRGPVVFGPTPMMTALMSPWNWLVERAAITLDIRLNSNPPMAGGSIQKLLVTGAIPTYPGIDHFEKEKVVFVGGQSQAFDAVVLATGYRYTISHLLGLLPSVPIQVYNMESTAVPGLFFLGMDQQRTYRSRYLRGIRADAIELGQLLSKRLAKSPIWKIPKQPLYEPLKIQPEIATQSVPGR